MVKKTIIADLEKYAQKLPDKLAVSDKKVQLTYKKLFEKVQTEAAILQEYGVGCSDKIAVLAVSRVDYVIAYLAVQYLGAVSVPIDKSLGLAAIEQICEQTQCKLFIGDEKQKPDSILFVSLKNLTKQVLAEIV